LGVLVVLLIEMIKREFVSRFGCEEKWLGIVDTRCTSRAIDDVLTVVDVFCMGLFVFGLYGTCYL
jgi:hypothetical protein